MKNSYNLKYVWTISLVAAMGGLLFGYDFVVIGGAKLFYEKYFNLTSAYQVSWANSCALVGCLIGAVISGGLSDKFGRKILLIFSALLFTVTSIGTGMANVFYSFVAWRLLGGVAIGLASNLSPMYIAEISPAQMRGKLVSLNQLAIVIGIVAAQLVNYLIAMSVPDNASTADILNSWYGQMGWRWMFGLTAVPALLFFALTFTVPESPRWLAKNGKHEKARGILARIGGEDYADRAIADIEQTLVNEIDTVNFRDLLEPKLMPILLLGVILAVFQQWCGINVIFNYAEEIFKAANYGVNSTLLNIVATGVVNFMFTFVAIFTVDRVGRRFLMLIGSMGLAIIYLLIGACFHYQVTGTSVLAFVLSALACYSCTLAPITWVILSEIFPNRIRGAAMSVAVFALWIGCFTLTFSFPLLLRSMGMGNTFWLYAVICAAGFLFILLKLPETKNKTLEQIERELVD
jgi:sugar porter (SP) family MFS transporter